MILALIALATLGITPCTDHPGTSRHTPHRPPRTTSPQQEAEMTGTDPNPTMLDRIDLVAAQTRRSRSSQLLSCIEWTLDNTAAEVA